MARPLEGKRILVTRAAGQAEAFAQAIAARGGEPVEVPVIAFRELGDESAGGEVLRQLSKYRWVIFTSANGVRFFFKWLQKAGVAFPAGVKVAVVGKKTLEVLQDHGVNADVVPDEFVAESLLECLKDKIEPGDLLLLPRGNLARKRLPQELTGLGADVTDFTVYETVINEGQQSKLMELLVERKLDVITFTSSSAVRNFCELLEGTEESDLPEEIRIACIGPVTAKTAREHGLTPDIIPEEYSTTGLLDAIEQFYGEVS